MSSSESKDKLEKLIQDSKARAVEITRLGGNIVQWGQEIVDLSEASARVLQYPPPAGFVWETTVAAWQHLNDQQKTVVGGLMHIVDSWVTASGSAAAYSMTHFANPSTIVSSAPLEKQDAARADAEHLGQVLDRLADKESALGLLRQFGLDKATPGKKSPVELFETAWAAFEKPVTATSPIITSLIPMRECIRGTIETLLRHRRKQEVAKNEHTKIMSIGMQLAHDGTQQAEIESWAVRWSREGGLLAELSGSKDADFSREKWQSSLRRATLFLREILQSLDPAKFR